MSSDPSSDRLQWWREARFGLFIHWGLYAIPAGTWNGERIAGIGEWIMRRGRIPIAEYEKLAGQFNPVRFDAEAWVGLAKRAGMKYLVITAKHHDGFCLFESPSNPYNIVAATPFGRDPMKELAAACAKAGLKMCFYYSQAQDWHAPGGAGHWEEADPAKDWHGYTRPPEDFARYLDDVVKPNVRELLTNYGPIGLIWFDTPVAITREQSEELRDLVHELQPECLVSGRVGHDVGDYGSMGDNQIPAGGVRGAWETPATMNDTWGFKSYDDNWKSVDTLLYLLVDLASKGVNYLLNVGPTAEGLIPAPSVERLEAIGRWMDVNGEAIYGTEPNPYPAEFDWGRITRKGNSLYLLVTRWPEAGLLHLTGLRSRVRGARLLADAATPLDFSQTNDAAEDWHELEIELPKTAPDACVSVIRLALDGPADVDRAPLQQADGGIVLSSHTAAIDGPVRIGRSGMTEGWTGTDGVLGWQPKVRAPGRYRVEVVVGVQRHGSRDVPAHEVSFRIGESRLSGVLTKDRDSDSPRAQYFPEAVCVLGEVDVPERGAPEACLLLTAPAAGSSLCVSEVRLVPVS